MDPDAEQEFIIQKPIKRLAINVLSDKQLLVVT